MTGEIPEFIPGHKAECLCRPEAAIALRQRLNETVDQLDTLRKEHTEMEVRFETINRELTIAKSDRLSFLFPCSAISTDHHVQLTSSTRTSWISSTRFANRSMKTRRSWKKKFKGYESRSATSQIRTKCNLNRSMPFCLIRFPCNPKDLVSVSGCWSERGISWTSRQALLEKIYQRRSRPGC